MYTLAPTPLSGWAVVELANSRAVHRLTVTPRSMVRPSRESASVLEPLRSLWRGRGSRGIGRTGADVSTEVQHSGNIEVKLREQVRKFYPLGEQTYLFVFSESYQGFNIFTPLRVTVPKCEFSQGRAHQSQRTLRELRSHSITCGRTRCCSAIVPTARARPGLQHLL
jgi:hypothetical protein